MSVLYCQSPALFWCALALIVCFFVRRGAHRVRAVLDLVLGLLCIVGGVALYYLGMYNDAFTIRDFWQIRTAGWIGLALTARVHEQNKCPRGGTFFIPYQSLREHFSASMASTTIRAYRASPGSATSMV